MLLLLLQGLGFNPMPDSQDSTNVKALESERQTPSHVYPEAPRQERPQSLDLTHPMPR